MNRLVTLRQLARLLGVVPCLRLMLHRALGRSQIEVRVRGLAQPLTVRFNNSDVVLLIGVFLLKDSHVALEPRPASILDLGANIGLTAIALAHQYPEAAILALEPDPGAFALCARNTRAHPRIACVQRAIGSAPGAARLANPGAISMARAYTAVAAPGPSTVRVSTIPELIREFSLRPPILIKIDVEGAEIDLFESASEWLPRVNAVLVEPHGPGTSELIHRTFVAHGFTVSSVGEKILGRSPILSTA